MNTQDLLEKIARQGLHTTASSDIVSLACAYWYEGFLPNLERVQTLPIEQQRIIGYLTEFFSSFNCIEEKHAIDILTISDILKSDVKPTTNKNNVDDLAAEWGLSENINKFLGDLLFYQTRHYNHPK